MKYPSEVNEVHPVRGWAAEEKTCETCGNPFVGWNCHRHCPQCPRTKRRRKPPEIRICQNCGKEFQKGGDGRSGFGTVKFCPKCREGGRKTLKAEPRDCKQCGKKFRPGWTRKEAELCSRTCQAYWINANGLGPKHDDEKLLRRLVRAIRTIPYPMSQEMLIESTGVARNTLETRKWTMDFLYDKAGLPYVAPSLDSYCEERAFSALKSIFPDVEVVTQARILGLVSDKGRKLALDFYIPAHRLIVEIDGPQHQGKVGGRFRFERIRANDYARDLFAKESGLTMLRIPSSAVRSTIKKKVLQALKDSDTNSAGVTGPEAPPWSKPTPSPRKTTNPRETPLLDVYCRGCHARPSFKNIATYLCFTCWERWNTLRRQSQTLDPAEVDSFRKELTQFIKERGRYVWHPEVYLHLRPVSISELKKHGIKVASICRELRFFAPKDDRPTAECIDRVHDFVRDFSKVNERPPSVREIMAGVKIDHTSLWSMDYEECVRSFGGRISSDVRYRFRDPEDFLRHAAEIVKRAKSPLVMTEILEKMGLSYPAYLEHFRSINREMILREAGVKL